MTSNQALVSQSRPKVWFVDDLPENLERFRKGHEKHFAVRLFGSPAEVLDALKTDCPDALLCDIFFYGTLAEVQDIEQKITAKAKELRDFAATIHANDAGCQLGINLIEEVAEKFGRKPPFPIYAYTSKGPYMLESEALDRIWQAGAKLMLKGRRGVESERLEIIADVRKAQDEMHWKKKVRKCLAAAGVGGIVLGWLIGRLLDQLWSAAS